MSLTRIIRDIQALAKKKCDSEMQELVIELREQLLEMQEENMQLKTKVQSLDEELSVMVNKTYQYESPFYWRIDGIKKDGPFCQHCLDIDRKPIRLQERIKGAWFCTNCDIIYKTASFQNPLGR